jgi:hypothetical protein
MKKTFLPLWTKTVLRKGKVDAVLCVFAFCSGLYAPIDPMISVVKEAKRLVVKIGSSLLTNAGAGLDGKESATGCARSRI